jgi:hypothetical protein
MKIIDNFLSDEEFLKIQKNLMGPYFEWHYNPFVDYTNQLFDIFDLDNYQFIHNFAESDIILIPLLEKLNIKEVVRIKSNLSPRTEKIIKRKFHIDVADAQTSIFYINTNDGWTEFEDGTKVESIANRLVTFDSNLRHRGTTCTNSKVRVVINLNYK